MAQTSRISKNNTVTLDNRDGSKSCILHKTEILRWWPEQRKVRIDTGGWFTATTRTRLMQCFNEWGLPFSVSFAQSGNSVRVNGSDRTFGASDVLELSY